MVEDALGVGKAILEFLKFGGGYALAVIEGYVIYKLYRRNEELHAKIERTLGSRKR